MWLKNAVVMGGDFRPVRTDVRIEGEKIAELGQAGEDALDCAGLILIPGLIDIHTHACDGADASSGSVEELQKISRFEAMHGVTSFLPTTMTLSDELLLGAMKAIRTFDEQGPEGAYIHGINMEGPYLSDKKRGAHKAEWLHIPSAAHFRMMNEASGGRVRLCSVAPETEGAMDFIREVHGEVKLSIAHTAAGYDQAMAAFDAGVTHATHTYNAMSGFAHRAPGVVGAIFDSNVTAELICDCLHIHPAVIRSTFRMLGRRLVMISDSMAATGLSDGVYELGGLTVYVRDGAATLEDGTIAGSTTPLSGDLKKTVQIAKVPFEDVVYACTAAPAKVLNAYDRVGSIETGKTADLVALDADLNVERVWVRGRRVR